MKRTDILRFPSGRAVGRVKQDAKWHSISLDLSAANNGLSLPWAMAVDYLKDCSDLNPEQPAGTPIDHTVIIPERGKTTLLLGRPGDLVSGTVGRTMMLAAKLKKQGSIAFVNYAASLQHGLAGMYFARNKMTCGADVPMADFEKARESAQATLDGYRENWARIFAFVEKNAVTPFSVKRLARKVPSTGEELVFAYNPRNIGIIDVSRLPEGRALVIADGGAESLFEFAGRQHLGLNASRNSDQYRRAMLSSINRVVEQRALRVDGAHRVIYRICEVSDAERQGFRDEGCSVKETVASISDRMPLWCDVLSVAAKSWANVDPSKMAKIERVVARMDREGVTPKLKAAPVVSSINGVVMA